MAWSPERVAELKQRWAAKQRPSEIAKHMGVSQNAIVGKADRLGLESHFAPGAHLPRREKSPRPDRVRPFQQPAQSVPLPDAVTQELREAELMGKSHRRVSILELTSRNCHWPMGDVGRPEFGFCGAEAEGSYCGFHSRLAYGGRQSMPAGFRPRY